MNAKRQALIILLALSAPRPCHAASSGKEPLQFLFLDANARAVGLGGAYTALARDANALLYNPGGLGKVQSHEATFMHNQYFEGVAQEYLAYASPYGWGALLNYLSFGDVPKTTISNPSGSGLGSAGLSDLALAVGYGRRFHDEFSVGAGLKYVRESIAGAAGHGMMADLGALYAPQALEGLTLGLAAQNLGPSVKYQSAKESLPLNLRLGAAYEFNIGGQKNTLSLDVAKERSEQALVGAGLESIVAGVLPVRVGFNTRNDAGPKVSAGLGWIHEALSVDYAFVPFGELGTTHRISATWRWGRSGF